MPLLGVGQYLPICNSSWSAYMTCNNSNLKLPFLAIRCLYWGVHLPVDLPIWPVTIAIWNCHYWPLDCLYWGVDLPSWSAYMTCNNSNLKLPALATRYLYWDLPVDLPIWPVTIEIWNCHSWPLDASTWRGVDLWVNLPIWPVTIAIWNCHSWPLDASTGVGVDLPVDLPMWPVTIVIWNCHSWPLDASTGGGRSASWSAYMTCNNSNLKLSILGH